MGVVSVRAVDNEVIRLPAHQIARSGLGYVPQVGNVFPSLTVVENLEIGGYTRQHGLKERIGEVLEIFPDLKNARIKRAGALSRRQRKLLCTAPGRVVR